MGLPLQVRVAAFFCVQESVVVASIETRGVHQQKIAAARRRRLEELEVKEATLGLETPPHILNEIEDIRGQLTGAVSDEPPISADDRYHATMRAVMLLSQQLAAVEVKVERLYWLLPIILFLYLFASWALEHLR